MNFYDKVYRITKLVPRGKVATYGQIAAALGSPRAARMVGMALSHCSDTEVPWQRVINRYGMISIENMIITKDEQVKRLAADEVEITLQDGNYFVDLAAYLIDSEQLLVLNTYPVT